ncbi:NAD-dependent epimerase/dehydratase family protein [bacterium]|nr:NAD-dependent epimerase/dehydratase family protein [bacterium]
MKILVTGGSGFIGSHITDKLIEAGHTVSVIDNLSTGNILNLNPKAHFYQMDIRDDKVKDVFEKESPQVVYHLAAQINVRKSEEDPFLDTSININGSINIIRNFIKLKGEKKLIFSSTGGAIYGEAEELPTPETAEELPLSPYGISKLAVEKYLFYYSSCYQLDFVALRFGNVYGPRQNSKAEAGVIAIFAEKLLNNEQPIIFGDGKQTRDFVYIEDVVNSAIKSINKNLNGIYNIGTGIETDINYIFDCIKKDTCSNINKTYEGEKKAEVRRSSLSAKKFQQSAGWAPSYTIEEGIKNTVKWFKSIRT